MTASEFFTQILIDFLLYFPLVAGLFGLILFFIMLRSLSTLKKIGQIFNKTFSLKKVEANLNRNVGKSLSYILVLHPGILGAFLCIISLLLTFFFAFKIEPDKFIKILHVKEQVGLLLEILMQVLQWLGIVCLSFVFFYSLLLLFKQELAFKFFRAFDKWYNIDETIEKKMERTISKDIDTISFLLSKSVGWTGLTISFILTLLSLYNLLFVA